MSDALRTASETETPSARPEEQLSRLFGSYKAEWLSEQLFDLFSEPSYWPELATQRPCVLVGGRGTGKTTVLRVLSYEGQYALRGRSPNSFADMPFVGFYNRVDTNRVRTFSGPEILEQAWVRVFGHYLNLSMVQQVLTFADWYRRHAGGDTLLEPLACEEVALSLNLDGGGTSQDELLKAVRRGLLRLEAEVNNVGEGIPGRLSMQKAPVDLVVGHLRNALPGKQFFFLFDEYENFTAYQQRIVNTFIKHSGEDYSFKVGVRELGFENRSTLNEDEQLISPADYSRISVADKLKGERFKEFAAQVCNGRLARLGPPGERGIPEISEVLRRLSEDEEAILLGVDEIVDAALSTAGKSLTPEEQHAFRELRPLDQLVLVRWSGHSGRELVDEIHDYSARNSVWRDRVNNYGYGLLFTLQRGRGRGGVQKYYAGWDTFTGIAAGNIRYVLELVEQTLLLHLQEGGAIGESVSPRTQTLAAQAVGRKNLTELEGLSVHGAQLTRLVLGLGRVFQLLAVDPLGHTPEVNEFELADPGEPPDTSMAQSNGITELLRSAVMHLALIRYQGTKVSTEASDTRDFDFRLHPIFSPAFVFSHRRKRKLALTSDQIMGLVHEPRDTIPDIMKGRNRHSDEPLPDQLRLFASYFLDH